MTLSIRNAEVDALAKRLAKMDNSTITDAVATALKEAIANRAKRETATQAAARILAEHGLAFPKSRKPVPPEAYHELDHDLTGEADDVR